uniref:Uncharacterized protein n=1 Tax=Populus trichocarpa TaxID=3694 RepID=A0A3N7FES8_POPTR
MKKLKERSGVYGKGIMFSSGVSTLTSFSRRPRFISNHCGELLMWWLSVESIHCLSKTVDESSVIQRMSMVSMLMCSKSPPAFTYASSAGTVQATSQVSWRCLTIVQLRQTCCIPLSLELGSRTIDSRSQRSNQRLQANMLIGFDIETPSTFVLRFSLSDFVFCSGLKTQH